MSNNILSDIQIFLESAKFATECIANKFNVNLSETKVDSGVPKYLDGYEISPHPDVRKKALTYMKPNINPHESSENINYHTHYMRFNNDKKHIQSFWANNPKSRQVLGSLGLVRNG